MKKKKMTEVERQSLLEKLVDELMKDTPHRSTVRQLSLQLGIPCSGDPLTDIDTVLHSMSSVYLRSPRRREQTQSV
ncbi:MAG: hypothetical protein ACLGGX_00980 [Bdellovibrionia bacterium]